MVAEYNCIAPLYQFYSRFYQKGVCLCDKSSDKKNMKQHEIGRVDCLFYRISAPSILCIILKTGHNVQRRKHIVRE